MGRLNRFGDRPVSGGGAGLREVVGRYTGGAPPVDGGQQNGSRAGRTERLLQLARRGGYRIVPATVIAAGKVYESTVTIDAGSADGIKPEETVLNGAGLAGTVTSVSAHTSTVLLATDASAEVGVQVAGTGEIGVVNGLGRSHPALLQLELLDAGAVLRPGEHRSLPSWSSWIMDLCGKRGAPASRAEARDRSRDSPRDPVLDT